MDMCWHSRARAAPGAGEFVLAKAGQLIGVGEGGGRLFGDRALVGGLRGRSSLGWGLDQSGQPAAALVSDKEIWGRRGREAEKKIFTSGSKLKLILCSRFPCLHCSNLQLCFEQSNCIQT